MIQLILPMRRLGNRNLPAPDPHLEVVRCLARNGKLSEWENALLFPFLIITTIL